MQFSIFYHGFGVLASGNCTAVINPGIAAHSQQRYTWGMILSASRRTDIPAFYGKWFLERQKAGEVLVRNPLNPKMVSRIPLVPEHIDCIVFWTKNPIPIMCYLDEMESLGFSRYYFHITLTPYSSDLEPSIPPKNTLIDGFIRLSERIGKERVIWRYDPIIITNRYSINFHIEQFYCYYEALSNYTEKCVLSFVDSYTYLTSDFSQHGITEIQSDTIATLISGISAIVKSGAYPLALATCCETVDLSTYNVMRNRCIDGELIQRLFGIPVSAKKDPAQRKTCLCAASRDIGAYNTCGYACAYCYARRSKTSAASQDFASPLLGPPLDGTERIHAVR